VRSLSELMRVSPRLAGTWKNQRSGQDLARPAHRSDGLAF